MYYSIEEAKQLVIQAGHKLLEKGLVARTWGNISARISEDEFVITPSGRGYEDLQPKDLVVIKVADASYTGNIKPSSEKILHAACYRLRKDVGFIIHTHQLYATALSVCGADYDFAPCAAYGLPGTKKLAKTVSAAVAAHPESKSFLMQRHGAVMLGKSFEEAFALADELEQKSQRLFLEKMPSLGYAPQEDYFCSCKYYFDAIYPYIDDYAQIFGPDVNAKKTAEEICRGDDEEARRMILEKNAAAMLFAAVSGGKPMGKLDVLLQHRIYVKKYSKLKETNHE